MKLRPLLQRGEEEGCSPLAWASRQWRQPAPSTGSIACFNAHHSSACLGCSAADMLKSLVGQFRTFQPNFTNGLDLCYIAVPANPEPAPRQQASSSAEEAPKQSGSVSTASLPSEDRPFRVSRIIACCAPSEGGIRESLIRNDVKKLVQFLDTRHGAGHYRVYNLTEKPHRAEFRELFHNEVVHMGIPDHNVPTWEQVQDFCEDVDAFLAKDDRNVIVVHCKAGKGRTGTLICCYLLYSGACRTTQEALDLFAQSRSRGKLVVSKASDGTKQETIIYRGVDQASQLRWVHYFGDMMRAHPKSFQWIPRTQEVRKKMSFAVVKNVPPRYKRLSITVRTWGLKQDGEGTVLADIRDFKYEERLGKDRNIYFFDTGDIEITREIKVSIFNQDSGKPFCRLWIHPAFLDGPMFRLTKTNLDDVWSSKKFSDDFVVEIHSQDAGDDPNQYISGNVLPIESPNSDQEEEKEN